MSSDGHDASRLQMASIRLCAYRLDPNIGAEKFVETLDELIAIAGRVDPQELVDARSRTEAFEEQLRVTGALFTLTEDKIRRALEELQQIAFDARETHKSPALEDAVEKVVYILREKVEIHVAEAFEG